MKVIQMQCIRRMWCIRSVPSDRPDFASVDEAICAALPLLMPFIKRAYQAMTEAARRELRGVERALERLLDAVERVGWSPSLEQRLAERERDKAALNASVAGLESRLVQREMKISDKELEALSEDLRKALAGGPPEEVRELLGSFIHEVVALRRRATIRYRSPLWDAVMDMRECPQGNSNPCRHLERVVS